MYEYKQGVTRWAPVKLTDSLGNPVTGVVFGSITAAVLKSNTTIAAFAVTGTDWFEATTSAFAGEGVYAIKIPGSVLNELGMLTYAVDTGGLSLTYTGSIKVVAYEEDSPGAYADAVWDEPLAGHLTAGSTGEKLDSGSGGGGVSFYSNGDTVNPTIVQVASPKQTQVKVTYSEAVVMTSGANGALNPLNYVIPGLTVIGVVSLTSQQVLITTSAQTPNILYALSVSNVEDLVGNVIL